MKLSKIYTNLPQYFKPIKFNNGLNVVFGKITKPKDQNKDSHNLGKSLLIDVIDYCLLKEVHPNHFTQRLPETLSQIEFYLEVSLQTGSFLTIKRGIEKNTKICFKQSPKDDQDFTVLCENEWDHFELSLRKSKEFLDGKLNLTEIQPFPYRMGISYFLRKQKDYLDVFQVEKFSYGKHVVWKPYIGKILGFDSDVIKGKYDYDNEVELKSDELKTIKNKLPRETLDKLRARIEAEKERVKTMEAKLDSFDFKEKDLQISQTDLKETEESISYINNEIYNFNIDLTEISRSLDAKIFFNIEDIKKIFKEVNIHFKTPILKEYKDLENFNIRLTRDRNKRLKAEQKRIEGDITKLKKSHENLNANRMSMLSIIRERDSFKKYKKMQVELVKYKSDLQELNNDLKKFEELKVKISEVESIKQKLSEKVDLLHKEVEKDNKTLSKIRLFFRELVTNVLHTGALLYVEINNENNIDFFANYTKDEDPTSPTSEGEGSSYHKFLCAFFDLAILRYYKDLEFYHFVYHDGILEGLDDRKKQSLIESIKEYTKKYNVQYILTVIESDLPHYENGEKFEFSNNEVVKELTDEGDKGRLFHCPIF